MCIYIYTALKATLCYLVASNLHLKHVYIYVIYIYISVIYIYDIYIWYDMIWYDMIYIYTPYDIYIYDIHIYIYTIWYIYIYTFVFSLLPHLSIRIFRNSPITSVMQEPAWRRALLQSCRWALTELVPTGENHRWSYTLW